MCKLKRKNSKEENERYERHVKVIGQLYSQRSKQYMMTSTNHVNEFNKPTSHLTYTKSKLVKQK